MSINVVREIEVKDTSSASSFCKSSAFWSESWAMEEGEMDILRTWRG